MCPDTVRRIHPSCYAPAPHRRIVAVLIRGVLIGVGVWFGVGLAAAEEIQIAVASNFSQVAKVLAARFEDSSAHRVTLIPGSTAKHFAQIENGAPFDIFLAADSRHPQELEDSGTAVKGTRFTYAFGELVLWSPRANYVDGEGRVLETGDYRHLAVANPDLAPYGTAAREVLVSMRLWEALQDRTVRGENIGQAFQFVASGNAELGFVARSQIIGISSPAMTGSYWQIPQRLYSPIEQQAVLVRDHAAAWDFIDFLKSDPARAIIQQNGYSVPGAGEH